MYISIPDIIRGNVLDASAKNWRIQAILIRKMAKRLLLINSHFPQDMKTIYYTDNSLEKRYLQKYVIYYRTINLMTWTGDINLDFTRNSGHVPQLHSYIEEFNMLKPLNSYPIDFTHKQHK